MAPSRTPSPAGTIPTAWLSASGPLQVQGGVKQSATVLSPVRAPVSGAQVRAQQVVRQTQPRQVMHTGLATQVCTFLFSNNQPLEFTLRNDFFSKLYSNVLFYMTVLVSMATMKKYNLFSKLNSYTYY